MKSDDLRTMTTIGQRTLHLLWLSIKFPDCDCSLVGVFSIETARKQKKRFFFSFHFFRFLLDFIIILVDTHIEIHH